MATLTEWIRQLVLIVFVVSVAQLLLPADGMRPYVRFVLGLVIVSALLSSVLDLASFRFEWPDLFPTATESVSESVWRQRGEQLVTAAAEAVRRDGGGGGRIAEETAAFVLGPSFRRAEAEVDGDGAIRRVTVWVQKPLVTDEAEAARLLGGLLGLPPERIAFAEDGEGGFGLR